MFVTRQELEDYLDKSIFNERRIGRFDYDDQYIFSEITTYKKNEDEVFEVEYDYRTLTLDHDFGDKHFTCDNYKGKETWSCHPSEHIIEFRAKRLLVDPGLAREMNPYVNLEDELGKAILEYEEDLFFLCFFLVWYCRWYNTTPPNSPFMVDDELYFEYKDDYDNFLKENQEEFDDWVVSVVTSLKEKILS